MTPVAFFELLGIVIVVLTAICCGYAWLASSARELFTSPTAIRRLNRVAAVMMTLAALFVLWRG